MERNLPSKIPQDLSLREAERVALYLEGGLSDSEHVEFVQWLVVEPGRAGVVDHIRKAWDDLPMPEPGVYDVSAALAVAHQRMRPQVGAFERRGQGTGSGRVGIVWRKSLTIISLAAAAVFGIVAVTQMHQNSTTADANAYTTYSAPIGRVVNASLLDGSQVTLAPGTTLQVKDRDVQLTGEAIFDVASDPNQPFIVRAGASVTRVLGTKFSVRKYEDDVETRVAVLSGRVALNNILLNAGDIGRLGNEGVATVQSNQDVNALVAWTHGRLVFRGAPLRDVAAQLTRWYGLDIVITDPALAHYRVTTVVSDSVLTDDRIAVLEEVFNARILRSGNRLTISPRL